MILSAIAVFSPRVVEKVREVVTVGSASSPSVVGGCMEVNGVTSCYGKETFKTATSTLCVLRSPLATSTLVKFTAKNNSATTTALVLVLERTSNPYAPLLATATSTSVIAQGVLLANDDSPFTYFATSTTASGEIIIPTRLGSQAEFAPGTYLTFYADGTAIAQAFGAGSIFTGNCQAEWQTL